MGRPRQTSPTVMRSSRPVWATKMTSAVRAGLDRRRAPRPAGAAAGSHACGPGAPPRASRALLQPLDGPRRRRVGVKLPPSGKITSAPVGPRPRGQPRDLAVRRDAGRGTSGRAGRRRCGSRLITTSRLGSNCSAAFITIRGRRWYAAEQVVDEQERVAGAGVAAEHDHRAGQPGRQSPRASAPAPRSPPAAGTPATATPEQRGQEPADQPVVPLLERLGAQPAAEPADHPQAQAGEQRHRLHHQPDQREPDQPQRAAGGRPRRRSRAQRGPAAAGAARSPPSVSSDDQRRRRPAGGRSAVAARGPPEVHGTVSARSR